MKTKTLLALATLALASCVDSSTFTPGSPDPNDLPGARPENVNDMHAENIRAIRHNLLNKGLR